MTRKPRSHVKILIYRTWAIVAGHFWPDHYSGRAGQLGTRQRRERRLSVRHYRDYSYLLTLSNVRDPSEFEF